MVSVGLPTKCLWTTKDKRLAFFTVRKQGRHHFNEVIRVNISSHRTNQHICHLIGSNERNDTSLLWYFAKDASGSNNEEMSDKCKLKDILQNNSPGIFKSVKVMKVKER